MIKIAHRGYVNAKYLENSYSAISKAIELGYDMVEIDIRETKDQRIILNHDDDLNRVFGINKKTRDLSVKEIKTITGGDVLTLEGCLKLCKDEIGLLIEIKDKSYSRDFLENIYQLLKKYKMLNQVLIYPPREDLIEFYLAKVKVGVAYNQIRNFELKEGLARRIFALAMPEIWTQERIKEMHDQNLICLTTVKKTYFDRNFPGADHLKLAKEYIHQLKQMGIDAINIDSDYHKFLFSE
ncbi:glycerophosphodiester phosphodiesterase [Orenia marismortui]|uniref:Glycerophosphoryl diester phosphodiesterase family protein n=1 Tax=Orenia marismortui TaxID=46469 RepID=A0A4R8GKY1_9FIRM|nr:glycerophosphodiester phosphodiesterase family protein [Orenia marismortui]TDX46342.1 glycerophosphoryl diester phosphodiesterase family protein [Orenia marismortui]